MCICIECRKTSHLLPTQTNDESRKIVAATMRDYEYTVDLPSFPIQQSVRSELSNACVNAVS